MEQTNLHVEVRIAERMLRLLDGEREVERLTVGVGRPESPTRAGRWTIQERRREATGGLSEGPVMQLSSGHCLRAHGDRASLGQALSGG